MSRTVFSDSDPGVYLLAGKRALIVDDDDDARQLLRVVLESCQMTVCDSDCVEGALEALDGDPFDLIISDIGMPDRDGYSFIRAVRQRPDGGSIPAAALTSFVRPEDLARARLAGFDLHLSKPFQSPSLIRSLGSLLGDEKRSRWG